MYHFVSEQTPELRLSDNVLVTSHTTQYLKSFQLDAVRFIYEHLSKQEFCILNDESGLGKCAAVVALLGSLGSNKKTLIVLQNDDQLLVGWQFHFGILTELPVCVIQNTHDTTASAHSVYLAKWSVLRSIGDLSKLKFDYVIVDHRGFTLNNNFCTSMLIKQFERKVNLVISSVDITSDVKLLYNVLRMGGRLESQYKGFRSFEHKYYLPDAKEVFNKKVDLEEYYKQRGILGDYIQEYRLRRYRHQFEPCLPLVTLEQYKSNLSLWLTSNNNSNSTLSSITIESSTDARSTAGTDEIMECLMSIKIERELAQKRDEPEKLSEHSEEVIAMSPLIFEMSDSEVEEEPFKILTVDAIAIHANENPEVVMLSSDDCDIVTPPATPQSKNATKRQNTRKSPDVSRRTLSAGSLPVKNRKKRLTKGALEQNELTLALPSSNTPMRTTRSAGNTPVSSKILNRKIREAKKKSDMQNKSPDSQTPQPSKCKQNSSERTPRLLREANIIPKGVHSRETRSMQRLTRSADTKLRNKYMTTFALDIDKTTPRRKPKLDANTTPKTSKKEENETPKKSRPKMETATRAKATRTSAESPTISKTRKQQEDKLGLTKGTAKAKSMPKKDLTPMKAVSQPVTTVKSAASPLTSKSITQRKEDKLEAAKNTTSKPAMSKGEHLKMGVVSPAKTSLKSPQSPTTSKAAKKQKNDKSAPAKTVYKAKLIAESQKKFHARPTRVSPTPQLLSSGSTNSEYAYIQCGQKLPENLTQMNAIQAPAFRIPHTPHCTPMLLSSTLNLLSDSEVAFVPLSNQRDVVVISSSHDESSEQSCSTQSRRTRALKRKRANTLTVKTRNNSTNNEQPSTSSFGMLLAQQRERYKSPDIFSNCSDLSQLAPTQPAANAFEGFKIFGSEVKHMQQHHARTQQASSVSKKKSQRSCLDILEQMFEPRQLPTSYNVLPSLPPIEKPQQQVLPQRRRTLLEDDIFEITNNGEFGSRLRLNSTGDVSPVQQQQLRGTQNKITSYFVGSGCNNTQEQEDELQPATSRSTASLTLRKSPKGIKSTQSTKLTRWFGSATTSAIPSSGESVSAPSTPVMQATSAAYQAARSARSSGPTKRKRLELFK